MNDQQQANSLGENCNQVIDLLRHLQLNQREEMGKAIEEAAKTLMEAEYSRKFDEQKDKKTLGRLKQVLTQSMDQRADLALNKVPDELAELTLSGKSEEEMNQALDEMAKKLIETGYSREFDEEKEEDKELYEKMKQYLKQNLEALKQVLLIRVQIELPKDLFELFELAVSGKSKEREYKAIEKMAKELVALKLNGFSDMLEQRMRTALDEELEELVEMLASSDISDEEQMDIVFEEMAKKLVGAKNSREFDAEEEGDKEMCENLKQQLKQKLEAMQQKEGASGRLKIDDEHKCSVI